jgi:hypothetical protein
MKKSLIKNSFDMLVIEGIIYDLSVPAVFYQLGLPERPELMGNRRFGHPQEDRDITYTHFGVQQGAEDFDAGGITEHLKQIRQIDEVFLSGHAFPHGSHHFLMDGITVAMVNIRRIFPHGILQN